jgi:hypothetical protein
MAVILTIAASAEAVAHKDCSALHHGGKATATISDPGRTCNDSAAIATKLVISSTAALSQAGHRNDEMVVTLSIERNNMCLSLMSSKCRTIFRNPNFKLPYIGLHLRCSTLSLGERPHKLRTTAANGEAVYSSSGWPPDIR